MVNVMAVKVQVRDVDKNSPPFPRCTMCARPVGVVNGQVARYCGGSACRNPVRLCQICNSEFQPHINGARAKYCANCTEIKDSAGWQNNQKARADICAVCGETGYPIARGRVWPYLCKHCLFPIRHVENRLRLHHVKWDLAKILLTNPDCPICGTNMLIPIRQIGGTSNRARAQLAVDHDHNCCASISNSCGECVRGLICMKCNTALGLLKDDSGCVEKLLKYIQGSPHASIPSEGAALGELRDQEG